MNHGKGHGKSMMGCKTYEERCFLAENSLVLNLAQVEKLERTVARLQSENDVQRRMVAAANMTWTSTVPTHTGHYWYADHSHPVPIMVFVALYGFEDMVHYMSGVKVSLKSHHGQWCAVPQPTMNREEV